MKKQFYFFLVLVVFAASACGGKKYGHYSYAKKKITVATKQAKPKKQIKPSTILTAIAANDALPQPVSMDIVIDTMVLIDATKRTAKDYAEATNKINTKNKPFAFLAIPKDKQQITDTIPKGTAVPHPYANAGMVFGIISLFLSLFAIFYTPLLFLAFVCGLGALLFSKEAYNDIKKQPEKYTNKGAALIGLYIGSIYGIIVALALLAIILYVIIIAIAITVIIIAFIVSIMIA